MLLTELPLTLRLLGIRTSDFNEKKQVKDDPKQAKLDTFVTKGGSGEEGSGDLEVDDFLTDDSPRKKKTCTIDMFCSAESTEGSKSTESTTLIDVSVPNKRRKIDPVEKGRKRSKSNNKSSGSQTTLLSFVKKVTADNSEQMNQENVI